jgi:aspartate dehydrogenase
MPGTSHHSKHQQVTLLGFGAIGRAIYQRMAAQTAVRISHIVVRPALVAPLQAELGPGVQVVSQVPEDCSLLLECAGHSALGAHVLPALARGTECAVLSVGALAELGLPEQLADAAQRGATQVHLLAGAIGGIDALAAARLAGLSRVSYTGRKPPLSWLGTPAEEAFDLARITAPTVILQASAREAARLYPKNANVAATLSLAGLGLDATQVSLVADPTVSENIHEVELHGEFGHMSLTMRGKPLADNPITSALTVLSAMRFLHNRVNALTL